MTTTEAKGFILVAIFLAMRNRPSICLGEGGNFHGTITEVPRLTPSKGAHYSTIR